MSYMISERIDENTILMYVHRACPSFHIQRRPAPQKVLITFEKLISNFLLPGAYNIIFLKYIII